MIPAAIAAYGMRTAAYGAYGANYASEEDCGGPTLYRGGLRNCAVMAAHNEPFPEEKAEEGSFLVWVLLLVWLCLCLCLCFRVQKKGDDMTTWKFLITIMIGSLFLLIPIGMAILFVVAIFLFSSLIWAISS
jgi:hypothetical protein